ncbi:MAG: hypothetical protein L3K08_04685 [Thermoplasmata archaeon]|nr:hypothetical protein [Thermoplasmata archaeon]
MGRSRAVRRARAIAPGHLTGFFVPDLGPRDPRARGSTGVGLVLDRGVLAEARYDPTGPSRIRLRSRPRIPLPISREVARRLLADHPGTLEVDLRQELPVGQGLGMSAAGAVATGLAVAQVLQLPAGRAWETAHLAELYFRGGLGGVAAIGGGGLEHRIRPGVPPFGLVHHRPCAPVLDLLEIGAPIPSPSVLGDSRRLARIRRAGLRSERAFSRRPTLSAFLEESERFTDHVGLAPPSVIAALEALRGSGRAAAQAMFGQVVFVVTPRKIDAPWPELQGPVRRIRVSVGREGARKVPAGVGSIFEGMEPTARWVGSRP